MKKIFAVLAAAFLMTGCAGKTSSQPDGLTPETKNTSSQPESAAVTEQTESTAAPEQTESTSAPEQTESTSAPEQTESTSAPEQTESTAATEEPAESHTEEAADSGSPITVNYAGDVIIPESAKVFEFSAAGALQPVQTVFTASRTVADLKVLALTCEDIDEDGNITFSVEELMTIPEFTADSVLNASLEYIGTIPNNGISYTDPDAGKTRRFAVNMSGKDGSLFLWEF